ncbi:hypothetical protein HYV11_03800 [Candidatus Dependentiae bacterium]|nr:hypothetical protein [Candidatus Dependentiae bacterium]
MSLHFFLFFLSSFVFLVEDVAHSMEELAVMFAVQQGASVANQAISSDFNTMLACLSNSSRNLNNSMKFFSGQLSNAVSNNMTLFEKIFSDAQNNLLKTQGDQSKNISQMQSYIFQAVSLHKPTSYYLLSNAAMLDQAFTAATMYTPQGRLWKNIFGYGDWEYDENTDSFWQMQKVSVFSMITDPATKKEESSSSQAANNSIFTEYFTNKSSYEIECVVTIYALEYPFFVGVLFNKTRWISGNLDSFSKERIAGIYASSENEVGIYYSEQREETVTAKNSKSKPSSKVIYPLDQIIKGEIKSLKKLPKGFFNTVVSQPLTLKMRIITSPKTIQLKIWQQSEKEPTTFFTITSKNQDLYLYHGIGCMSPGAIAEFTFTKPEELLFSAQAKEQFAKEVQAL